jgi:hypothetical protein
MHSYCKCVLPAGIVSQEKVTRLVEAEGLGEEEEDYERFRYCNLNT